MNVEAIRLDLIDPDPSQPRHLFRSQEMAGLASSMRASGLLQPITVAAASEGRYQIITGERRYRAAQINAWTTIDCVVRPAEDKRVTLELQLVENVARADMTPMEEAEAYQRLVNAGRTPAEIDELLGLRPGMAGWRIDLLELIGPVADMVHRGTLGPGKAYYLVKLSAEAQQQALRLLNRHELSDAAVGKLADRLYEQDVAGELFPQLMPATEESKGVVEAFEKAMTLAADALGAVAALDDDQLLAALRHRLPGVEELSGVLAGESRRLHRRLRSLRSLSEMEER